MAVHDLVRIEEKLDRVTAGATLVSDNVGGVMFQNMSEILEFSKLMALSDTAVPKHLRGNPGACLRIVTQALEWRMSPFAVADKSYFVNDKIAYESQLVHAIIEQRAPLEGRLRHRYEGEGPTRVCIITGKIKGESEPIEYRSPPFADIKPKNSPLWQTKPDLQLYYNATRDFCRIYFPDVLLGIYSKEELEDAGEHTGPDKAKDITPDKSLRERLQNRKGQRGFSPAHVEDTIGSPAGVASQPGAEAEEERTDSSASPAADDPAAIARQRGVEDGKARKPRRVPPDVDLDYGDEYLAGWDLADKEIQQAASGQ